MVDFIDVGFGSSRFWVFNLADISVHAGAVLLYLVLWREERRKKSEGMEPAIR